MGWDGQRDKFMGNTHIKELARPNYSNPRMHMQSPGRRRFGTTDQVATMMLKVLIIKWAMLETQMSSPLATYSYKYVAAIYGSDHLYSVGPTS